MSLAEQYHVQNSPGSVTAAMNTLGIRDSNYRLRVACMMIPCEKRIRSNLTTGVTTFLPLGSSSLPGSVDRTSNCVIIHVHAWYFGVCLGRPFSTLPDAVPSSSGTYTPALQRSFGDERTYRDAPVCISNRLHENISFDADAPDSFVLNSKGLHQVFAYL